MKIEVISAANLDELNRIIADKKPDRVDGVRIHDRNDLRYGAAPEVMNQWTEYSAVLYWDDFCEWVGNTNENFYTVPCAENRYATKPDVLCACCGKPVRIRLVKKP